MLSVGLQVGIIFNSKPPMANSRNETKVGGKMETRAKIKGTLEMKDVDVEYNGNGSARSGTNSCGYVENETMECRERGRGSGEMGYVEMKLGKRGEGVDGKGYVEMKLRGEGREY